MNSPNSKNNKFNPNTTAKFKGSDKETSEPKSANRTTQFFTPKTYIIKKKKLPSLLNTNNSKETTKKDDSLLTSSSEGNLFIKSNYQKELQFSQEMSDIQHKKRIKDYFSEKSLHLQTIRILEILSKEKSKQKRENENTLQTFIHKNFNEDMPDRLKTFEKFAFSNVERDEHKYIKPILSEIKTFKEPHGTMLITDLWSKNLQKECLEKSNMLREKKMLEKYLFYKNKSKKSDKFDHHPVIITRNNEQILKNELVDKKEKNIHKKSEIKRSDLIKFERTREEQFIFLLIFN